jgi:hypothetical protein
MKRYNLHLNCGQLVNLLRENLIRIKENNQNNDKYAIINKFYLK